MAGTTRQPTADAVDLIIEQWRHARPDVDVSAMSVFGRLHRSFYRYQDQIGAVFREHGITMAAFDVLSALRRNGEPYRLPAGRLAEQTLVTTGGMTLRVDRLESDGLVRRERDASDGRVVYVALTEAGMELIDAVVEDHFRNERRMLRGLSATEQRRLADLLSRVERSLELAELTGEDEG